MQRNETIRKAARVAGVPLWKIAERIGVSEITITRWLRKELPPEKEAAILAAIQELEQEAI